MKMKTPKTSSIVVFQQRWNDAAWGDTTNKQNIRDFSNSNIYESITTNVCK